MIGNCLGSLLFHQRYISQQFFSVGYAELSKDMFVMVLERIFLDAKYLHDFLRFFPLHIMIEDSALGGR